MSLIEVNIPIKVQEINMENFVGCDNLSSINVDKDNANYSSIEGILFNKNQTIIFKCPLNNKNKHFSSPSSLERIEEYAFHDVKNIEIVNLTKNVNNIGEYAFANSTIKEIYFYGEKPEFGENALLNLNVTIYYPINSKTWNISNFEPLGAKDIRFVPWSPIEEEDKGFFEEHKTLIIIIAIAIVLIIIGIIICIIIRKREAKTDDNVDSLKGGLINENMANNN